jgi:murein DD-endopeptidase MepM/ murein hydrolase activator NlpD
MSLVARVGHDRTVALVAAAILLGASVVSVSASRVAPATGGTTGPGSAVRLAVGGDGGTDPRGTITEAEPPPDVLSLGQVGAIDDPASPSRVQAALSAGVDAESQPLPAGGGAAVEGPFLDDGTLLKPVAVDTTVADGSDLMESYRVQTGDTLTGIAAKSGVSMMTIWWANKLTSKDDLYVGQTLIIPPVSGLVVTVGTTDTLDGLAARYEVAKEDILAINQLEDPNLIVGQVLMMPGALGNSIPLPKPAAPPASSAGGGSGGSSVRPPANYTGGAFLWPVVGGGNYVSQGYNGGHGGFDIAADYGSTVRAAAAGTVIFAGWKNNGGGYQVWIAHGDGLYTTYNHMSAISVGNGQTVNAEQQVGRVGSSGNSTGSHLHFEVWRGGIWSGGSRVNPGAYL